MTVRQAGSRFAIALALAGASTPQAATAQQARGLDSLETALVRLVSARQPELLARRAAAMAAEARFRAAGPVAPPTLGLEIENIPDWVDLADAGQMRLVLERDFLTGSRRAAERGVAEAAWQAATVQLELAERSVGAEVRAGLAAWLGWREVAARLAAQDTMLQGAEAALAARFATGQARYVDVLRLRTERLRVRSARADAMLAGRAGLRQLEGMVPATDSAAGSLRGLLDAISETPALAAETALPTPPDPDSLLTALGVLRLGHLAVAAARAQAAEVSAFRSTLLTGGIGVQRFGDAGTGFTWGPSLRAQVTLPFAVGGSNRALNQAAALAVTAAQEARAASENRLRVALGIARDRYAVALERERVYRDAMLAGARDEREAAVGAYRAGELSLIELLDFERALSEAETGRIRAAMDAQAAYADLMLTAAGLRTNAGLSPDFEAAHD